MESAVAHIQRKCFLFERSNEDQGSLSRLDNASKLVMYLGSSTVASMHKVEFSSSSAAGNDDDSDDDEDRYASSAIMCVQSHHGHIEGALNM